MNTQTKQKMKGNCEICGRYTDISESYVNLWFYGKRKRVKRMMCKTCQRLEKNGKL